MHIEAVFDKVACLICYHGTAQQVALQSAAPCFIFVLLVHSFFAQSLLSVAGTAALTQWESFRAVATLVRIMKVRGPSAASSLSSLARPSPISWLMTSAPACISDALPQSGSQPGEGIIRLLSLNITSLVINMLATPARERLVLQAAAASPSSAAYLLFRRCSSMFKRNVSSMRHAGCGCRQDIGAQ